MTDSASYELIDAASRCSAAVFELLQCPAVAVDLEGVELCRTGKICLLQIAFKDHQNPRGGCKTYLFDVLSIGTQQAFATLKPLLESTSVSKVMFDVRADSDALQHQCGIRLRNAYDLQVLYMRKFGDRNDAHLKGFKVALGELYRSGGITLFELQAVQRAKDCGHALFARELGGDPRSWEKRPLTDQLLMYAASDVEYLLAMKDKWGGQSWDTHVEETTDGRIETAVTAHLPSTGPQKALLDFPLQVAAPLQPTHAIASQAGACAGSGWQAGTAALLCVPLALVPTILREGFTARVRPNVAVALSPQAALEGFSKYNAGAAGVVLTVLDSSEITRFTNAHGSHRIQGRHIPPHCLRQQ